MIQAIFVAGFVLEEWFDCAYHCGSRGLRGDSVSSLRLRPRISKNGSRSYTGGDAAVLLEPPMAGNSYIGNVLSI